jgi:hypothetical protein
MLIFFNILNQKLSCDVPHLSVLERQEHGLWDELKTCRLGKVPLNI